MNIESIEKVFRKSDGTIIDVREPNEYKDSHLKNSKNIPKNELLTNASYLLDKNEKYYFLCRTGKRSYEVAQQLSMEGYHAVSIEGGLELYQEMYRGKTGVYIGNKEMQLRYVELADVKILNHWWNDGEVMASVGYPNGLEQSIVETEKELLNAFVSTQRHQFMIELFQDEIAIGECHFKVISKDKVEIGIKIGNVSYQNKGYGKKALQLLLESLFANAEINIVCLTVFEENKRAQQLYESLGFTVVQVYEDFWKDASGATKNVLYLELTRKRYCHE